MSDVILLLKQPLVRRGVNSILKEHFSDRTVKQFTSRKSFMEVANFGEIELIITNLGEVKQDPVLNLSFFKELNPDSKILLLVEDGRLPLSLNRILLSVSGLLSIDCDDSYIAKALNSILDGAFFSYGVEWYDSFEGTSLETTNREAVFTYRQIQILKQLREGKRNKEIAEALQITESTVKMHIQRIRNLLGIKSRVLLADYARRNLDSSG